MKYITLIILLLISKSLTFANTIKSLPDTLVHGKVLFDIDGKPINAHGSGVMYHQGVYYLFGEIKNGKTWLVPDQNWEDYRVPAGGISCYSSTDLKHWKYRGVAFYLGQKWSVICFLHDRTCIWNTDDDKIIGYGFKVS